MTVLNVNAEIFWHILKLVIFLTKKGQDGHTDDMWGTLSVWLVVYIGLIVANVLNSSTLRYAGSKTVSIDSGKIGAPRRVNSELVMIFAPFMIESKILKDSIHNS